MPISNSLNKLSVDFTLLNVDASTTGPQLEFRKSRSLTGGPVQTNDTIGQIVVGGSDSGGGISYKLAIQALSVGTIGPDRIPFNLNFYTAQDAALAPEVLRMVIPSEGGVSISKGDDDTQNFASPAPSFSVIGSSVIAINDRVNTDGAYSVLLKTRAGLTITSGDFLGSLSWIGSIGGGFESEGARIMSQSSGSIAGRVPANLTFWTKPDSGTAITERVNINSSGTFSINRADNDSAASAGPTTASLQVLGSSIVGTNQAANTFGGICDVLKNRLGGPVVTGDDLGYYQWVGYDSASLGILSAQIRTTSTGTIGANKVPSNMFFAVSDDATGALNDRLTIQEDGLVAVDVQLAVGGDLGAGTGGAVDFTNTTDLTANGAGTFTILSKSANPLNSSGFLKIYVNGTVYYIPLFSATAP
jgi:hypothetical protein